MLALVNISPLMSAFCCRRRLECTNAHIGAIGFVPKPRIRSISPSFPLFKEYEGKFIYVFDLELIRIDYLLKIVYGL